MVPIRRRGFVPGLLLISFVGIAVACGGDGGGGTPPANIFLTNSNNYKATAKLTIPIVETAPLADLDICWDKLVQDLQCHTIDPVKNIDNVSLIRFRNLTTDQIQEKLAAGSVPDMIYIDGYGGSPTGNKGTCTKLSQFTLMGSKHDYVMEYTEDGGPYMLLFSTGISVKVGGRAMLFLKPTAGSTNTKVDAPNGCGLLDFTADLSTLTKVNVPAQGPWVVGWKDVTMDGQGNPVSPGADKVLVGFYEGKDVPYLQQNIFDIETMATNLWELKIDPRESRADLSRATERTSHTPFGGFKSSATGTWMLAVQCTTCTNPAPVLLTIVQPASGAP